MSAVAIIPARGGSRRIPRKNIRPFMGKPIIAYSIEAAKASGLFDRIYVTTEDEEIMSLHWGSGSPAGVLPRPKELARDKVGTQEVMRWALQYLIDDSEPYDYACCIYPCAPTLTADDLWWGHQVLHCSEGEYPYCYVHGWFYWGRIRPFLDGYTLDWGIGLQGPPDRWIDINTESDWSRAEAMYRALKEK